MIWTHPKNWRTPFCWLKITKTEGAKIVSEFEKAHKIHDKNQKEIEKKINPKKH